VPIVVRHHLRAIALYGAHSSGEDIDPDELKSIERLTEMASGAYDHIEAESLRVELEATKRELDAWRAGARQRAT
jgi:hypothetical protein